MSKVLVVGDIHLKPWILDFAEKELRTGEYNKCMILGDIVDDWGQENNLKLYEETLDKVIFFCREHENTLLCFGNHDMSYCWRKMESGYSVFAEGLVERKIKELKSAIPEERYGFIHRIDNVLFSHAGLVLSFVMEHFGASGGMDIDGMIAQINRMGMEQLWKDNSPIWARPQYGAMRLYPFDMLQVVGHTPVEGILQEENLITVDNFSTMPDGSPIGDDKMIRIDTVTLDYTEINCTS